LHLEN